MTSNEQVRTPKGKKSGGEFATHNRADSTVGLADITEKDLRAKLTQSQLANPYGKATQVASITLSRHLIGKIWPDAEFALFIRESGQDNFELFEISNPGDQLEWHRSEAPPSGVSEINKTIGIAKSGLLLHLKRDRTGIATGEALVFLNLNPHEAFSNKYTVCVTGDPGLLGTYDVEHTGTAEAAAEAAAALRDTNEKDGRQYFTRNGRQ